MVTIALEMPADEAEALAQFMKRVGWSEWRQNAVDDAEASKMRAACGKLAAALAEQGYNPR